MAEQANGRSRGTIFGFYFILFPEAFWDWPAYFRGASVSVYLQKWLATRLTAFVLAFFPFAKIWCLSAFALKTGRFPFDFKNGRMAQQTTKPVVGKRKRPEPAQSAPLETTPTLRIEVVDIGGNSLFGDEEFDVDSHVDAVLLRMQRAGCDVSDRDSFLWIDHVVYELRSLLCSSPPDIYQLTLLRARPMTNDEEWDYAMYNCTPGKPR